MYAQAIAGIAASKAAGDKETASAGAEWRQLTQLIEHDRKQQECLSGQPVRLYIDMQQSHGSCNSMANSMQAPLPFLARDIVVL